MAIKWAPFQPSMGQNIGSAIGAGLSGGLEELDKMRTQALQDQQMASSLQPLFEQMGLNPELATSFVKAPYAAQQQFLAQQKPTPQSPDYLSSPGYRTQLLKNFDRRIRRTLGKFKNAPEVSELAYGKLSELINNGIPINQAMDEAIQFSLQRGQRAPVKATSNKEQEAPKKTAVKTKKLTPKIVDKFLKKTNNNPKEARELARKAGYEV